MVWAKLIETFVGSAGLADSQYRTELATSVISYYLLCYSSILVGGLLAIEQYFSRRINCFTPSEMTNVGGALEDYCWQYGSMGYNNTQGKLTMVPSNNFLLQTWLYYFLRAAIFLVPQLMWDMKCKALLVSIIKTTEDLLKELSSLWLQFAVATEKEHSENAHKNSAERKQAQVETRKIYNSIVSLTKDVINITQLNIPHYRSLYTFIQGRLSYELLFLVLFAIFDSIMFITINRYTPLDFYCPLPNNEVLRCAVPALKFQWYTAIIALVCIGVTLILTLCYCLWLTCYVRSAATNDCMLELIPFAHNLGQLQWENAWVRRIYKLVSLLIMKNTEILYHLNFLRGFVKNLEEKNHVGSEGIHLQTLTRHEESEFVLNTPDRSRKSSPDDGVWTQLIPK